MPAGARSASRSPTRLPRGMSPSIRPSVPMLDEDKTKQVKYIGGGFALIVLLWFMLSPSSSASGPLTAEMYKRYGSADLTVASWNIAAINNNPFEYWITHNDAAYNKLMEDVQDFIASPGNKDVPVHTVFSDTMFAELAARMKKLGWDDKGGVAATEALWQKDFRNRKIIAEFMKDGTLGDKRLASMPDRTTNTILTADGPVYRPTVINCYGGDLGSIRKWWEQWREFVFNTQVKLGSDTKPVSDLLIPIKRSKYPALTEAEEKISIPLQTMAGAIFDSILVYIVNKVSPNHWQGLRKEVCDALNLKKTDHTLGIIATTYVHSHIICLQEVAKEFITTAQNDARLQHFVVVTPPELGKRDQNSVVLLNGNMFDAATIETGLTADVWTALTDAGGKVPVATGDIVAVTVSDHRGEQYMIASFHGDTNGLATIPVMRAVAKVHRDAAPGSKLIFGLDANTYEHAVKGKTQDVLEFASAYRDELLTSVWGDVPDPTNHTTFNARTYLQPQLNKAARKDELVEKGDVNPKDFILFSPMDFVVKRTYKDNTGRREYKEGMVFPTLEFPSDHGVLSTELAKIRL
eukprot:m.191668 g.191668  ORF g.191668 m.191668 type:complete len:578 (-) comp18421_c0_seq1:153-1886(-)